jgi:predicted TIM-barrel fold metal-dependent hydrolase
MAIVDIHTHFFSRTFFDTLAAQASSSGGVAGERLADVVDKTGLELPEPDVGAHLARWIADMDAKGVEHMATFASVPEEIATVGEAAQRSGGRLSAFALVNPVNSSAAEKVAGLFESGAFKGVLVFPAMHHFKIGEDAAKPLLAVLNEQRATIFVHCGLLVVKLRDLFGLPRPQDPKYADPLSIVPAANAYPDVRFVIPHFGAGLFRETLMAGAQCPNVYVDTSSSNSWTKTQLPKPSLRDVFERALDVFGTERVLFGTDSNVFPAGWRKDRYEEQRAVLADLGLSTDERERIFAGNARRLLGLGR